MLVLGPWPETVGTFGFLVHRGPCHVLVYR